MVLETWATDFIVNDQQSMFITTQDDPIQRRPKINYFNNDSVQNMIPIVSHISSNGYYGYCATPTTPSNNVLISVRSGIDGAGDIEAAGEIEIDDGQMDFQNTNDHTQHMADRSTERRKRCQKFSHDEELIAMKRCRNQTIDVEIGEDRLIRAQNVSQSFSTYAAAGPESNLFTTSSFTPTANDSRMIPCIDTTTVKAASTPTTAAPTVEQIVANDYAIRAKCASGYDEDIEQLFWYTHGAVFWHCDTNG